MHVEKHGCEQLLCTYNHLAIKVIQSRYAVVWNAHFVIRSIWILSDIWLMFISLKRFVLILNGWVLCDLNNLYVIIQKTRKCLHESQMKTLWLSFVNPRKGTSSRWHMFFKIDVLKNFYKFHRKTTMLESLLINYRVRNLVVSGLLSETKGSRFESGC